MASRTPRKRHLRYGRYDRQRRSKRLKAFIAAKSAELEDTGALVEFTAVDAAAAVAGTDVLTFTGNAENTETVSIGPTGEEIVYTVVTALSEGPAVPYEVLRGANAEATIDNLVAAINAAAGEGVAYATGTLQNEFVSAEKTAADELTVTARTPGDDNDEILTATDVVDATWTNGNLTGGTDAVLASNVLTAADHGFSIGDGPFKLVTSGGLPPGLSETEEYWIASVPTTSTFTLTTKRGGPVTTVTDAGTGTHEIAKGDSEPAVYAFMKQNQPEVMRDADDSDDLRY